MKKCIFLFILLTCISLMMTACIHPYEGKHFSRAYPHSIYNGLPIMETIAMGTTSGNTVSFNYRLNPLGSGKYTVDGTMEMSNRVDSYSDINIYLLLLRKGDVVKAIRMNSRSVGLGDKVTFSKEFETDEEFNAVTFGFNVRYYH